MAILNKAREMGVEIPGACKLEVAFLLAETAARIHEKEILG